MSLLFHCRGRSPSVSVSAFSLFFARISSPKPKRLAHLRTVFGSHWPLTPHERILMYKLRFPPKPFLVALAVCAAAAFAVQWTRAVRAQDEDGRERLHADVSRAFERFDALELDPTAALKSVRQSGELALQTAHGRLELELEPFDVRADHWRGVVVGEGGVVTEMERAPLNTFSGKVRGEPRSEVRLVLDGEKVEGLIVSGGEVYYVEPAGQYSAAAARGDHVLYAASSVKDHEAGECGVTLAEEVAAESSRVRSNAALSAPASEDPNVEKIFAPRPVLELATEADFEYFQLARFGGSTAAAQQQINQIVTMVDGVYAAQTGVNITISFSRVWSNSNDPYTLTESSAALNELRTAYNGSFAPAAPPARDLTHMWTGKDLDGSTIGIAYLSVVCASSSFSYGISQEFGNDSQKISLTAHEIGHNFSAQHPNQQGVGGDCAVSIMNSSITSSTNFCQFSRDQVTAHTVNNNSCLTRQTQPGCNYALSTSSTSFGVGGGSINVGVSTSGGCVWDVAEGASWLTVTAGAPGSGPGQFTITAEPNAGGARSAVADVAGQRITVSQAPSPTACFPSLINLNQTVTGTLSAEDCRSEQTGRAQAAMDRYAFAARAGQRVRIEMNANASSLDTYLYLFGPNGAVIAENDDIVLGEQTNSRIPDSGFFLLPATGIYTIGATSYSNNEVGGYSLILSDNRSTNTVSFSGSSYTVNEAPGASGIGSEGSGFVTVTVNRGGDVTGTALVNYALANGTADRRRDYQQSLGTLVFAPSEASKTFRVHVTDDLFAPGSMIGGNSIESASETINLQLSNPVGTTLGAQSTAVINVVNDDATLAQTSPVRWAPTFRTSFFVRQHYLDFLGREPDPDGMAFWSNIINQCADEPCREVNRVNVSAAFFLSIEFQETGYLAYRAYKAAYGDATSPNVPGTVPVVRHSEFLADSARLGDGVVVGVGDWRARLDANKAAYANEFVLTPRFLAFYPLTMTPEAFVDQLNTRSGGALSASERDALVTQLRNGQKSRGAVLLAVAEDSTLAQAEKSRAFVLMQYYGYMRRNPDDPQDVDFSGWKFWLDRLNGAGGDFTRAEMVKAFIRSIEYSERFGH